MIDVDEDGDGGVVGWLDGTVFKVSTQKSGQKVVANTDASNMFFHRSKLTTLDLSGFDTSNVTYMGCMFSSCSNLTTLDLSGFDTSNVTGMNSMFYDCSNLTTIYISDKWKTASNNGDMFYRCGTSTLTHK